MEHEQAATAKVFTGKHKMEPGAFEKLTALEHALDDVQVLADYRGNFAAIHSALVASAAIGAVDAELAFVAEASAIRTAAPAMLAALEIIAGTSHHVMLDGHGTHAPTCPPCVAQAAIDKARS